VLFSISNIMKLTGSKTRKIGELATVGTKCHACKAECESDIANL